VRGRCDQPSHPIHRMLHDVVRIREANQADFELLVRMAALFGHGPGSGPVAGWMQPGWDFGLVAEDDNDPIGAAWWRRFERIRVDGETSEAREVFLAVEPEHQGGAVGGLLLDELILRAEADPSVPKLVGEIVRDRQRERRIREMLIRRRFTEDRTFARFPGGMVLWVRDA
jgi:GNAT superfamily N-acetyltransferase